MIKTVPPLRQGESVTITRHNIGGFLNAAMRWVFLILSGAIAFLLAFIVVAVLVENNKRADQEHALRLKLESQRQMLIDYMSARDELMSRMATKEDVPKSVVDEVEAKAKAVRESLKP